MGTTIMVSAYPITASAGRGWAGRPACHTKAAETSKAIPNASAVGGIAARSAGVRLIGAGSQKERRSESQHEAESVHHRITLEVVRERHGARGRDHPRPCRHERPADLVKRQLNKSCVLVVIRAVDEISAADLFAE